MALAAMPDAERCTTAPPTATMSLRQRDKKVYRAPRANGTGGLKVGGSMLTYIYSL